MARFIKREINNDTNDKHPHKGNSPQYSINSDGCLAMRWFDPSAQKEPRHEDTIVILSKDETRRLADFIRRYEV